MPATRTGSDPGLVIAQVTPFAWEVANEVNEYVARVSERLSARGHRVLIIAPSQSEELVGSSRKLIRSDPEELLSSPEPRVLGVGGVLPFAPTRRRAASLPVDVAKTIEELLTALPLDVVDVHEPFAPSASSVALRHSRALNVGSFHAPTEHVLTTQLAGPLTRLLFSRLDARIASYAATRNLLQSFFPGDYRVVAPGADPPQPRPANAVPQIVMIAAEERAALRTLLRALRLLPPDLDWHATVWSPRVSAPPATLSRTLRDRVTFTGADERPESDVLATADIAVLASDGDRTAPGTLVRALGAGAVAVASRLPVYEEILADGELGSLFEPGEAQTLAAHLERLISDPGTLQHASHASEELGDRLAWDRVAAELEDVYLELAARRRVDPGDTAMRRRLRQRQLIDVDLHMHTDHSYDCATPVEVLLAEARTRGLGAIAVTDHNEISGALEAQAKASGIKVIVGEEVKTAEQGEVIGLFITEKIAAGHDAAGDDRRDPPPGRDRVRAASVRPDALGSRLRASAGGDRRDRRDRGVQPAGRDLGVQRGGGAVRGQVPDPRRRRVRRPRPAGTGFGADPDARLRRTRGVHAIAARRRHHPQPGEPPVRPGAQVPADQGDAVRSSPRVP